MDVIAQFMDSYSREIDHFIHAARLCEEKCRQLMRENGVLAIVSSRAKAEDRLQEKLKQRQVDKPYASVEAIRQDIVDLAGARIALYFPNDRETVDKVLRDAFDVIGVKDHPDPESDAARVSGMAAQGYVAKHYRVKMKQESLQGTDTRYARTVVEIQVVSVMMHAWSEVEHDLRYKGMCQNSAFDRLNRLS